LEQLALDEESMKRIVIHIEIDDLMGGSQDGITDEDVELWDALCNEDRYHDEAWGVYCFSLDLTDKTRPQEDRFWWKLQKQDDEPNETADRKLSTLRERYHLAWQDIIRIPRFIMTTEIS